MSSCRSKRVIHILVAIVTLLFSFPAAVTVYSQVAGATLSGTVTDASGAAIPNAKVSIKNTATGITRDAITDTAGFYSTPNVSPGVCDVSVSAPGFSTWVDMGIGLNVGASQVLNVSLEVGQVNQKVEVTAVAPGVQLATSAISAEVNSTTVRELPLNGRDWTSLAVLQPGIIGIRTQVNVNGPGAKNNRGFGDQLAVTGHRPNENSYRINGINVNDYSNGSPGSVLGGQLGVDAIQEFSVMTTDYSAEYGRTTGGVINAVLKSGTNAFHGDAYWFLRDKVLDARNFFDYLTPPDRLPPFVRNQWGASAGGPIKKDRTFIFGDFEAVHQNLGTSTINVVPSLNARKGLLSTGQLLPNPLDPNGTDPATGIDLITEKYLPFYPLPDPRLGTLGNGDLGLVSTAPVQKTAQNYVTLRGDHKISEKDSLAAVWFFDKSTQGTPDSFLLVDTGILSQRQMTGLEETHIFSPTLVNTTRIGFSRTDGDSDAFHTPLVPLAADKSLGVGDGSTAPDIQIQGGMSEMNGGSLSQGKLKHVLNSFQYYDDAFLTRGVHSLKFGGAFERSQANDINFSREGGSFRFNDLQDFLTNHPATLVGLGVASVSKPVGGRVSFFGAYLQDDWRFRPNLTLNLGLRYEPMTLPSEAHNQYSVIENLYGGPRVSVNHLWQTNPTLRNFAPRVGFAWDPSRNGKTAVRGGFGIFDVLSGTWLTQQEEDNSYPFDLTVSGDLSNLPYSFPVAAANNFLANQATAINSSGAAYFDQNPKNNYAMNWNLNIQREITPSVTAMVGYVGSHTVHLPLTMDQADIVPPVTPGGAYWPVPIGSGTIFNPNAGAIKPVFWSVSSTYEGLLAQVKKTMSHGVQVQASYTWGKCLSFGDNEEASDSYRNSMSSLIFFAPFSTRGLCDFNIAHNFVVNYIWQTPSPKFGGLVAKHVLGGWQVGGIFTANSGEPSTVWIGGDPLGLINNDAVPYPDHVPGCNPVNSNFKHDPSGLPAYINLNCYTPPVAPASIASDPTKCVPYTNTTVPNTCQNLFGNAGRNSLIGPDAVNFDFSLFKNFPIQRISEAFNVQFRAEFFNIFNHANFQVPTPDDHNSQVFDNTGAPISAAPGGTTGGVLSNTGNYTSRQIQFSLKVIW